MKLNFGALKELNDLEDSQREHLPKILIVDDEAPNRNVLTGVLRKDYRGGYRILRLRCAGKNS